MRFNIKRNFIWTLSALKNIIILSVPGILGATIPLIVFWDQNHLQHASLTIIGLVSGHVISVFFLTQMKDTQIDPNTTNKNNSSSSRLHFRVYFSYLFSIAVACAYSLSGNDISLRGLLVEENFNSINDILLLSLPIHAMLVAVGKWWRVKDGDKYEGIFSSVFTNLGYYLGIYLFLLLSAFLIDWFISDIIGFELIKAEIEALVFTCVLLFSGLIFSYMYDDNL